MEGGLVQLQQAFAHVELRRYQDALHVTEVEPLVDYVQSTAYKLDDDELARFRAVVEEEINQQGFLLIAKSAGLFVMDRRDKRPL